MTMSNPRHRSVFSVLTATIALLIVFAVMLVLVHAPQVNAAGFSTDAGTSRLVKIVTTSQGSFAFSPVTLKIIVGTTVTWKNTTSAPHTVTSDDGVTFGSGVIAPGGTFKFKFTKKGTFAYHCNIHPFMKATVIVS